MGAVLRHRRHHVARPPLIQESHAPTSPPTSSQPHFDETDPGELASAPTFAAHISRDRLHRTPSPSIGNKCRVESKFILLPPVINQRNHETKKCGF